jgi:CTP-dependent riboflavin kinase
MYIVLTGVLYLKYTAGKFNILINENKEVFKKYFGIYLYPGSLNIKILEPENLAQILDQQILKPSFVIPKSELINMPEYIGNGQAWKCKLSCDKFPKYKDCWLFRRVNSRVRIGTFEIVAAEEFVKPFDLKDGDSITIDIYINE